MYICQCNKNVENAVKRIWNKTKQHKLYIKNILKRKRTHIFKKVNNEGKCLKNDQKQMM